MARRWTGRNGSPELKRAPKGRRTSSMNCCVLAYFLDTADLPVISQVMSSAKMLVTYPVPFAQEWNASATMSRLDLMAGLSPPEAAGVPRTCQRRAAAVAPPRSGAGPRSTGRTLLDAAPASRHHERIDPDDLDEDPGVTG